jgi:long-chain acyl-CoA synthetase
MEGASYEEIVTSDKAKQMVQGYIDELNSRLNRWETIKKWIVLEHDLTVESGDLTPSMKVKRKTVEDKYKDRIDALYAE